MTMYQDNTKAPHTYSEMTPEELALVVRDAHQLRRQAVASVVGALARRLKRGLRVPAGGSPKPASP